MLRFREMVKQTSVCHPPRYEKVALKDRSSSCQFRLTTCYCLSWFTRCRKNSLPLELLWQIWLRSYFFEAKIVPPGANTDNTGFAPQQTIFECSPIGKHCEDVRRHRAPQRPFLAGEQLETPSQFDLCGIACLTSLEIAEKDVIKLSR